MKAEKLLSHIAKQHKEDAKKFYDSVAPNILEKYDYLYLAFEDIVEGEFSLTSVKIEKP